MAPRGEQATLTQPVGEPVFPFDEFEPTAAELQPAEDPDAVLPRAVIIGKDEDVTDSIRLYLNQVGRTALLNAAQEVELAKRIEAGLAAEHRLSEAEETGAPLSSADHRDLFWIARDGENAKNHMLEANLRLVVSVAKRYTGRGMALLDVIQEGNLGLVRAVEKFDYQKGFKFSTYATWWINQAITRAMADKGHTIRVPVHRREQINRMCRTERDLATELGREAAPEEVAERMGVPVTIVRELIDDSRDPISLDQLVGDEKDTEFVDFVADDAPGPEDMVLGGMTRDTVESLLEILSEKEADIMRKRYGLDDGIIWTLDEVGKVYSLTRERIRQIETRAFARLKEYAVACGIGSAALNS